MKKCEIAGCDKPHKARGFCSTHHNRWLKNGDPHKVKQVRNAKIDFDIINGCFVCTSHKLDKNGYPNIERNRKHYLLHRYLYIECFGEIKDGLVVRHKCDNRACINPEHLELGTFLDNMNDKIIRNRVAKGEQNGQSKLRENDIIEIRRMASKGIKNGEIAKRFNISPQNVCDIKFRRSWKHIEEQEQAHE